MATERDLVMMEAFLYAADGVDPSKAITDMERRGTIRVAKEFKVPKKTNGHSVPHDLHWAGVTDGMSWEEQHEIATQNNINWTKRQYQIMGFKIIDDYDDLFFTVTLPDGWEIRTTDHSMWNEIYDDKGRIRANYFYKAAFYDRDAFTNFYHRYNCTVEPFDNYESDVSYQERKFKPWTVYITDGRSQILTLESKTPTCDEEYLTIQEDLCKIGEAYLNEHHPGWKDINAYWNG